MNIKMTTNPQLSTTEPQKLSKQLEWNHRYGDHVEIYQWGGGKWGQKGTGYKKHS